eukprot:127785_1
MIQTNQMRKYVLRIYTIQTQTIAMGIMALIIPHLKAHYHSIQDMIRQSFTKTHALQQIRVKTLQQILLKGLHQIQQKKPSATPTKLPTSNPSQIPTQTPTVKPTSKPTPKPTNPGDILACGDNVSGAYNGEPVTLTMRLTFDFGDVRFDAGASSFVVTDIEATTKSGILLTPDIVGSEQITLTNLPAGEYKFILHGTGAQSGTFKAQIQCFARSTSTTASPTSNPIVTTTTAPDVTYNPTSGTTATTAEPTKTPTYNPTTATPTSNPIIHPTTASPTHPGVVPCGKDSVGTYSSGPLAFETFMPFSGELTFDATGSTFVVISIEAWRGLDSAVLLGTDSNHEAVFTLPTAVAGDYKFIMSGETSGFYHVEVRCVSDAPTQYPTGAPIKDPTETPIYAPSRHPITAHPSGSPITLSPSQHAQAPTTDEPTTVAPPTQQSPSYERTTMDSPDQDKPHGVSTTIPGALKTGIYILLSLIIMCALLGCVAFAFYKHRKIEIVKSVPMILNKSITNAIVEETAEEQGFERDLVMSWLLYTVKLPQYADLLVGRGYDNMRTIQMITSREELREVGITAPGHLALIMSEIEELRGLRNDVVTGEASGEKLVMLSLPAQNGSDSDDLFGDMNNNIGCMTKGTTHGVSGTTVRPVPTTTKAKGTATKATTIQIVEVYSNR